MVFPVAAAAGRQTGRTVRKEGGADQREAEENQQQRCEYAFHLEITPFGTASLLTFREYALV
jgi:hypothetical protein